MSKTQNDIEKALLHTAAESLETDAADEALLSDLAAVRQRALNAVDTSRRRGLWKMPWLVFPSVATLGGLILAIFLLKPSLPPSGAEMQFASDFELLMDIEAMEISENDIDFYLWLEELEPASAANPS